MRKILLPLFVIATLFLHAADEQTIVKQYLQLANGYLYSDNLKSLEYTAKALKLSKEIGFTDGKGEAYWIEGRLKFNEGNIKESGEDFKKAADLFKESGNKRKYAAALKDYADFLRSAGNIKGAKENIELAGTIAVQIKNKNLESDCEISKGLIELANNDFATATAHFLAALKEAEDIKDNAVLGNAYLQLGNVNTLQGNMTLSNEYFEKALTINKKSGNKLGEADAACNLGSNYLKLGNFDKANEYITYSITLAKQLKYNSTLALDLMNLGFLRIEKKDFAKAESNLNESQALYEQLKDKTGTMEVLNALGYLKSVNKDYESATTYYNKAAQLAKEAKANSYLQTAYEGLAYINEQQDDFKNAYKFQKLSRELESKNNSIDNAKKFTQIQMNYEFTKLQEQQKIEQRLKDEISQARTKQIKIGLISVFCAALSLIALLITSTVAYRKNRMAKELLAERNEILQIQKANTEKIIHEVLPAEIELKLISSHVSDQERFASVMFIDFVDFSKREKLFDSMDLMDHLDELFKGLEDVSKKYELETMKTMVDGYLCIAGLEGEEAKQALENLIKASLDILQHIEKVKERRVAENKPYFEMKIGIHSGHIIGGIVAVRTVNADIWGNTVQIASAIEKIAQSGQILLSETSNKLVRSFETKEIKTKLEIQNNTTLNVYILEQNQKALAQLNVPSYIDDEFLKHFN